MPDSVWASRYTESHGHSRHPTAQPWDFQYERKDNLILFYFILFYFFIILRMHNTLRQ